ncbi:hypothetical protein [Streptomyces sp. N2A]|uniref:hypothetical protein n=1 Tax=Streptomyces sp. N2A TaxID=3073936 RepID=UPI0028705BDF|nr:hypothetical protein [Streptomyces sp. N2A]
MTTTSWNHPRAGGEQKIPPGEKRAAYERRHRAALVRPRVKSLNISKRLGPGWTLTQREGEAELERWLVEHDGSVHGMVKRYLRADKTFSPGWEAFVNGTLSWLRLEAMSSCQHRLCSSFLWSGRDLAVWSIATQDRRNTPFPPGPPALGRTPRDHRAAPARPPPADLASGRTEFDDEVLAKLAELEERSAQHESDLRPQNTVDGYAADGKQ